MAKERRDDRGVILVEFALVIVVFSMMVIGGLFVLLRVLSKSTSNAQVTAAANFVAQGGCPSTTTTTAPTTTTLPPCADGGTPTLPCVTKALADYSVVSTTQPSATTTTVTGSMTDEATLATLCEVAQQLGGSFVVADPSTLQIAINCSAAAYTTPGQSGVPCTGSRSVWVCARAWDSNDYPGIINPAWVTSKSEQIVLPEVATTTSSTTSTSSTTTTTSSGAPPTTAALPTEQFPSFDFETFFPANTGSYANTAPLTCGPMGS